MPRARATALPVGAEPALHPLDHVRQERAGGAERVAEPTSSWSKTASIGMCAVSDGAATRR
jgi:hypothetical protein